MLLEPLKSRLVGTAAGEAAQSVKRWRRRRRLSRDPRLGEMIEQERAADAVVRRCVTPATRCLDAGAHLGAVLAEMLALAPAAAHVAVEPTPRKAAWLRAKFPGVRVIEAALSDGVGRATFYDDLARSGFSGLRRAADAGEAAAFEVRLARLDDELADLHVDFVKMDVEGAELSALRGGRELLRRCRPVVLLECTAGSTAAFGVTPRDVWHELRDESGYELFTPLDFLTGGCPLDAEAFAAASAYPFRTFNFVAAPRGASRPGGR